VVVDDIPGPNGLCFAPDESRLYVVASRAEPHRQIVAYEVTANGRELRNKRMLIDAGPGGTPDGIRCDIDGNLWCGWGMGTAELDGVVVFAPDGTPLGRIALPERCANVCFGGLQRNRLFMAASAVCLVCQHPGLYREGNVRQGLRALRGTETAPRGVQASTGQNRHERVFKRRPRRGDLAGDPDKASASPAVTEADGGNRALACW
jgi:hypothetical protein